jgi:hypothetical protein
MPEVDGLEEAPIVTVDDVLTVVQRAEANRTVAGTDMNERSSRSHRHDPLRLLQRCTLAKRYFQLLYYRGSVPMADSRPYSFLLRAVYSC